MHFQEMNLKKQNELLNKTSPSDIISWALNKAKNPIITTNFGPYSASLLYAVVRQKPAIKVIWIDTGYNTPQTYKYAFNLIEKLQLNMFTYVPKQTVAFRDVQLGIPTVDHPNHILFTEQVKLEPFKRAMDIHKPDVWFTNLRKGQTKFRNSIDVLSNSKNGILKVSPFYNYSQEEIEQYLNMHDLPNEKKYYDPTKQLANRECGIHS